MPYAGMTARKVKALSESQIADISAGKGMMLALPAELNGLPGPLHALELADQLEMTETQKVLTRALFQEMQTGAKEMGKRWLESEEQLDLLFKERRATASSVQSQVEKAAIEQGKLRALHLQFHLKMLDVLTPSQVAEYNRLRGYVQ